MLLRFRLSIVNYLRTHQRRQAAFSVGTTNPQNDLLSALLRQRIDHRTNVQELSANTNSSDGFEKFKTTPNRANKLKPRSQSTWMTEIEKAKEISDFDMELFRRILTENSLKSIMDSNGLENKASFQELVRHFLRTYNFQLTGLVTMIFTKIFILSNQYWPVDIIGKPKTLVQAEADIRKIAECYDMISYGYYFHDLVDPAIDPSSSSSLRNLLILVGDYFLIKSSYDVASFRHIELYKIYVQSLQKYIEGEALSQSPDRARLTLTEDELPKDALSPSKDIDNDQSKSCHLERFSDSSEESETVRKLIDYCYLTCGHLFASSLQSAFKLANLSQNSQQIAFEFGKNFGMAIKMSNQLSALCMHRRVAPSELNLSTSEEWMTPLPADHLNLSYFAKFPTVSVEVMQYLVSEYVNRSLKLLISFCDTNESMDVAVLDQTTQLIQTLRSILNEIQQFNHDNVQQYLRNCDST